VKTGKVRYLGASSMHAWEFAKALHLQKQHGWARFVTMQDHYNLLAREEEREMIPLCLDEGVGAIIWSPLARGRLARPWGEAKSTQRSDTDGSYADLLYNPATAGSDRAIVDAVGEVATDHDVTRAQVALAWLRSKPVVTAPLVGANTTKQIDDAVASLGLELTSEEISRLERPYTPRHDFQGVSDEAEMQRIRDQVRATPPSDPSALIGSALRPFGRFTGSGRSGSRAARPAAASWRRRGCVCRRAVH
jgi:aryl-alcohol dehydrogenase-like predicted oxidoreductase